MSTIDLQQRWSASLMNNYGVPRVALVRGDGAVLTDADGKQYVDFLAGIAVNILGHGHPAVVEAVTTQLSTLGHVSNLYASEPVVELAEQLLAHLGNVTGRAFFCNSGTEANEAAFKLARATGRKKIIAAEGSFHGRTMGALALTGQPAKRAPFEPMPAGVEFVPYGDVEALEQAVDSDTAAVFLEPIMGEGGVVVPPEGYLVEARRITAERGALLVLDEVQTGIGRTGWFYAHQAVGIVPDVITLAKGLGGGMPIGACIATGATAELFGPGKHGTTFGGNPVWRCGGACRAENHCSGRPDLTRRQLGQIDLGGHRRSGPSVGRLRTGIRTVAGCRADRGRRAGSGKRSARSRVPCECSATRSDPVGAAAHPHGRAGRNLRGSTTCHLRQCTIG